MVFSKKFLEMLSETTLDVLFPPECFSCGAQDAWLCHTCCATVDLPSGLTCFFCSRPSLDGRFCSVCDRAQYALSGIWAPAMYGAAVVRDGIHFMKYRSATAIVPILVRFFLDFAVRWPFLFSSQTLFVPIPLHEKRERERGFNQAHLLTTSLLSLWGGGGTCGCWLVERQRETRQQVKLSEESRHENVRGAFRYRGPAQTRFDRVVLLDDVATTGATLEQCAAVFRERGANDVWGFVLAKG